MKSTKLTDGILEEAMAQLLAEGQLSEEELLQRMPAALERVIPTVRDRLLVHLQRSTPEMLFHHRDQDEQFRSRNISRWSEALNALEVIWKICAETGSEFNTSHRPEAVANNDYRFDAVVHLHARALQTTREIICLVEGGYADGALSRWRTLHEIAVISLFLQQNGVELSYRYLASFHHNALLAAIQINKHADRANLQPFSDAELAEFKERADAFAELGSLKNYEWAAPALPPNRNAVFEEIEKAVRLDHRRPNFKWASQPIHAGFRPANKQLGTSECDEYVLLTGASNSGMVDPLQFTAISLAQVHVALLTLDPTFENLVVMEIVNKLSAEFGPLAVAVEEATRQARPN